MILRSKVELRLPLSQLHYDTYGFRFRWNEIWLVIPYEQQPLEFAAGHLLEEFKNNLKGEITICLHWHRIYHKIEEVEVPEDKNKSASDEVADITSSIEQITSKIQSSAVKGSLTLEKARIVLAESGFDYNDEKIHRILSEIVNNMPLQQIQEEVEVRLSSLQYDADGVRFSCGGVWFQVPGNILPFETGPALENIKSRLDGTITFNIEKRCIVRWDSKASKLWVGQVTEDVSQAEIAPDTLEAFKELRGEMICNAIDDIDRVTLSLDEVESILKEWGLDLNNQEIGKRIASCISLWTEEKHFQIPLKDVNYRNSDIEISANGENVSVPAALLPFETSAVLENIKEIFEGDIKVNIHQPIRFKWDLTGKQLTIERENASCTIEIDDEILSEFKNIRELYEKLSNKFGPFEALRIIAGSVLQEMGKGEHIGEGHYEPECVRILVEMAKISYMTSCDFWFKIGNLLIWERPEYSSATYIFDWPTEPLRHFMLNVWGSTLYDIRHDPSSGFRDTVNHDAADVSKWKRNLESKIP